MDRMPRRSPSERGVALVAVLFVMAIFFVLAAALLFQSRTESVVSANEHDHLAVLGHAEAGLTWAQRRVFDATDITDLLRGPDNSSSADDNLIGLRDLSLTATSQFTNSNEATTSAIVQRDFDGTGTRSWEVIRTNDGTEARALVYVRIDDNFDDDDEDPDTNNDPLTDVDGRIRATVVAEYPVFVDAAGVERSTAFDRGRARRKLVALYGPPEIGLPAIASNGDVDDHGSTTVCGDCGSVHSNEDLKIAGSSYAVCEDATATGKLTGNTSNIGGAAGSGFPPIRIPTINPYDDILVPTIDTFDTSADAGLPAGLRCPKASVADPGANKYFAFSGGDVYKAYWDFGNSRWTWREIDDLSGANVVLDDCGRVQGTDANFAAGSAAAVDDGTNSLFYGLSGGSLSYDACPSCSDTDADKTLCGLTDNDYNVSGHYQTGGGLVASPPFPGSFQPDGNPDFDATRKLKNGARWKYDGPEVYSPLFGAVIWVHGGIKIAGSVGAPGSIDFRCGSGAGCNPNDLPDDLWRASIVAVGSIEITGNVVTGPANPAAGYGIQFVAGRDLKISGNIGPSVDACVSGCSTPAPAGIQAKGGAFAAHEQVSIGGTSTIFGFVLSDDAVACDNTASGAMDIGGTVDVFYDCVHPVNPWIQLPDLQALAWQDAE